VVEGLALALADLFYRFCAGAKFATADGEFLICKITDDLHLTLAYLREYA